VTCQRHALGESLPEGAVGVVVEEFTEPDEAYEVEFSDHDGSTIRQFALKPDQFVVLARRGENQKSPARLTRISGEPQGWGGS
jgi:hypothetical protein